jgi:hypothetical protein
MRQCAYQIFTSLKFRIGKILVAAASFLGANMIKYINNGFETHYLYVEHKDEITQGNIILSKYDRVFYPNELEEEFPAYFISWDTSSTWFRTSRNAFITNINEDIVVMDNKCSELHNYLDNIL